MEVLCLRTSFEMEKRVPRLISFMVLCLMVIQQPRCLNAKGVYNLTGSSEFAELGKDFTWTCQMSLPLPSEQTKYYVYFQRNGKRVVLIGENDADCKIAGGDPNYSYACLSNTRYTLTIPAENMTEFEQGSGWRCLNMGNSEYSSPNITLKIAVNVHNVSLIPSDNPLTLKEGSQRDISCVVNSNAVPAPSITWYIGPENITSTAGINSTSIAINGHRKDNKKTLICKAANNNQPPKTIDTKLNVEYPPSVFKFDQQNIIEKQNLSVTCQATPGNPSQTVYFWTKLNETNFRKSQATLLLPEIHRDSKGTYTCTAQNTYSIGGEGTDSQDMVINVLYPPSVKSFTQKDIIEGRNLSVTCLTTPGNPASSTVFWTKLDKPEIKQVHVTLLLPKIHRSNSGTYRCTAENTYSIGGMGTNSQDMVVNVLFPPTVSPFNMTDIREGMDLQVVCMATSGNPSNTTFYWTMHNNPSFRQSINTLRLPNIKRNSSGTYTCTAQNRYLNGENGSHSQDMFVNVLYKPEIEIKKHTIANESENVLLTREIASNPLSTVIWYAGSKYLQTQTAVNTTFYGIEGAKCTDTKNYTLVANNGIGTNVTAIVELIVNCKPVPFDTNLTLGVTDITGIEFSTTFIAFPLPTYVLMYENGTLNNRMWSGLTWNAVNNFTIHFNQTVVNQDDYGTYHLQLLNKFGNATIFVNVIPQRKPISPQMITVTCEVRKAKVTWLSSFNGGDPQNFTAFAFWGQQEASKSESVDDAGENKIHEVNIQNLQPTTAYVFYVSALNRHGFITSENISCTTKADETNSLPFIVGGAVGGITLAIIIIVAILLLRRFKDHENEVVKSQRLTNDECIKEDSDDGLTENILYVSAGPRNNNESDGVMYAAVTKKPLEDNANVYADVKKDRKKAKTEAAINSDAKPKKGKKQRGKQVAADGKKQRGKQVAADVYENSEDIAMTPTADNVYSNTNYNAKNDQEQRGYKNKDGLLYVDVQFDAKKGNENPVIHGEDEKTDYATVEFPMPTFSQEDASAEK